MKLSRREALVGAVAAVVAPKVPLPAPVAEAPYVNPWAGALSMYDVHYAILGMMAQQIAEEEDRRILGELTGEDPGPAGNRCVPETG